MTLQEELAAIVAAAVDRHPVLSQMLDADDHVVTVRGPSDQVLQQAIGALNAYTDLLLRMVMRVAEAVDDLD